ncbi:MAG: DUF4340 domain-containing protein [Verrucomicrobiae bacterium]|nr:DUF4340 domain-containing protein [Verrucomicrobiae bacterium]
MNARTTLILAIVVALVGAFVWWDYKKGTPTDKRREQSRRLTNLKSDQVTRLELIFTNQTIVLEKKNNRWYLLEPIAYRADSGTVNSMLDGLEFAEKKRTLSAEEVAGLDRNELGLVNPRLQVAWQTSTGRRVLRLGGETPTGDAFYAQFDGQPEVYIAEEYLFDRLNRTVNDLRDRTVLDFDPATTLRCEIKNGDRVLEFARSGGDTASPWTIVRPVSARADQRAVSDLLSQLSRLRVQEFVSDNPADLARYRLDEPAREITISRSGVEGVLTLLVSTPDPQNAGRTYAKLKTADAILALNTTDLPAAELNVADYRDRRVLVFDENAVEGIEVLRGSERLVLTKTNADWQVTAPAVQSADRDRVQSLLGKLRDLRVDQFVTDVATELEPYGLATPAAVVRLQGSGTNIVANLVISAPDASRGLCLVKRDDEPFIYGITTNLPAWLPSHPLDVRPRRVASLSEASIRRFERQHGETREVIERNEQGQWVLREPVEGVLNTDDVTIVLNVFAALDAEEFYRAAPASLDQPTYRFVLLAGDQTYTLKLAGQDASWSDPPLSFRLSEATVNTLIKPLVSTSASETNAAPSSSASP